MTPNSMSSEGAVPGSLIASFHSDHYGRGAREIAGFSFKRALIT